MVLNQNIKLKTSSLNDLIGNTPLIRINSLSDETGCEILAKLEYLNPTGSIKDRTAKYIIEEAEKKNIIKKNTIVEATAGNTGIGLASLCNQKGYKLVIFMPSNQSKQKKQLLDALGVKVYLVEPKPFSDKKNFYHQAKSFADKNDYFFCDQFENLSNFNAHYNTTGPEIWYQSEKKVDIFTASCGSGGTMAGVSNYLKKNNKDIKNVLADPMGSGLYSYIKNNEIKSSGSSIAEGIGIMRITSNFSKAIIDDAIRINDDMMFKMLKNLAKKDGLFCGLSSAINLSSAYLIAKKNKKKTIVTIIADHGTRYIDKIF